MASGGGTGVGGDNGSNGGNDAVEDEESVERLTDLRGGFLILES